MNKQIKTLVEACSICEKFKRNNQKEPLVQGDTPKYPYDIVAMDLFEYAGRDFIAIIDAYSNYLTAFRVNNKTSGHIIEGIRELFNRVGYPTTIKSDNSPFGSAEFDRFANEYNIKFVFSSPRYAQSNGLAEKAVAIAKGILKRCYESNTVDQFQYKILEYNTTPVASMGMTPSELFFGRLIKTKLPVSDNLLVRKNIPESEIEQKIKKKREKQKYYYDRSAKLLPTLNVGDTVIFKKNAREWNYGTIVANVNEKSYIIRDSFGNHFRRNRRFIAKSMNTGLNASELLFEEGLIRNENNSNSDNLREIQIVPPTQSAAISPNIVNVEAEPPAESDSTSDRYDTAGSDVSTSDSEPESAPASPVPQQFVTTRSNRVVRPPQRYGW